MCSVMAQIRETVDQFDHRHHCFRFALAPGSFKRSALDQTHVDHTRHSLASPPLRSTQGCAHISRHSTRTHCLLVAAVLPGFSWWSRLRLPRPIYMNVSIIERRQHISFPLITGSGIQPWSCLPSSALAAPRYDSLCPRSAATHIGSHGLKQCSQGLQRVLASNHLHTMLRGCLSRITPIVGTCMDACAPFAY